MDRDAAMLRKGKEQAWKLRGDITHRALAVCNGYVIAERYDAALTAIAVSLPTIPALT